MRITAGAGVLAVLLLLCLVPAPAAGADITFSDNNLVQGYSIDLYSFGNLTSGDYNSTYIGTWNSSTVNPFDLEQNYSYIGIIRQSQVARFNNFNELSQDGLDWITSNYVGLFFAAIVLLIITGRK